MSGASVIDQQGVAVITGGASGFGLNVAERLVKVGMPVAILDVSTQELANAEQHLRTCGPGKVLAVKCDVRSFAECEAADKSVAAAFQDQRISFLFNNAGIGGRGIGGIIESAPEDWQEVFSVNVFGAVNILKAFLPGIVERGPLPSGKKSFVVTTSSVVGLLNHNGGAYSCSKMATTAVCEQLSIELEAMGAKAAHVSPHSLHPTVGATNFLTGRGANGEKSRDGSKLHLLAGAGMTTAENVIDGLFQGLQEGRHYVVVDHSLDVPTSEQVAMRMQDQINGARPRKPEQLGMMLMMAGNKKELKKRQERFAAQKSKL